jgi:tetratricopeptide (TPR) repeat protein
MWYVCQRSSTNRGSLSYYTCHHIRVGAFGARLRSQSWRELDKSSRVLYRCILDTGSPLLSWGSRISALAIGAGLVFAARYPAIAGLADYLATQSPEGLSSALELVPQNAEYWELQATRQSILSPEHQTSLEKAIERAHHNARLWMKLGDAQAAKGNTAAAETAYKKAKTFDQGYEPRWVLANLYFRAADFDRFWPEIRETFKFENRDLSPGFELCWSAASSQASEVFANVPRTPRVLAQYLNFLNNTNRLQSAPEVAAELLKLNAIKAEQLNALVGYCERLLNDKQYQAANQIWTALAAKSLVPSASNSNILVNADMMEQFSGRGFDWRWETPGNVGRIQIPALKQSDIQFNGDQPENCPLLRQHLTLTPGGAYRFTFDYRTRDIGAHSGLRWRITDMNGIELQSSEELSSESWKSAVVLFRVPDGRTPLAANPSDAPATPATANVTVLPVAAGQQIVLSYERPRGTTRIAGTLSVRTPVLVKVN